MFNNIDFTPLMTDGYVVVPNFLDSLEKQQILDIYHKSLSDVKKLYGNEYYVTGQYAYFLKNKLNLLTNTIRNQTDLKVYCQEDFMNVLFFDNKISKTPWHQDAGSWFFWQQSYNLLNIWVPFIKNSGHREGVKVLPWTTLENTHTSKEIIDMLKYKGARHLFHNEDMSMRIVDDHGGTKYKIPLNIDEICVVPVVNEGDALIMRGDLIHGTADDQNDHRAAISIRCTYDNGVMKKSEYFDNRTIGKEKTINDNYNIFHKVDALFQHYDEITIKDAIKFWKDNGMI
jgi:ectoine hydroxylase-related dioxygenase (phytanoyl-CoA dioxygenase family)